MLHFFLTGQLHSVARDENLVVQVFQIGFGHNIARAQAQELKDVGVADDMGGLQRVRRGMGQGRELGFVFGEAAALVIQAVDLAAQFPHRPVAAHAFDFVEAALGVVCELDQFGEMGEREPKNQFRVGRWQLWSH